eukprot:g7199.t1
MTEQRRIVQSRIITGDSSSSSDSESDSDSSSSSEDEDMHRKLVFVPKNQRGKHKNDMGTSSSKSTSKVISSKNIGTKSREDRAAASRKMVIDATVVIEETNNEGDDNNKMPDDTDDIDVYEEMRAWRIREKLRVERFATKED